MSRAAKTRDEAHLRTAGLSDLEAAAVAETPRPVDPHPAATAMLTAVGLSLTQAAEFAPALAASLNRTAAGHVHAVHPDTGTAVVFMPGERLPLWYVGTGAS